MELIGYVAETLAAEKHAHLNKEAHIARLAKQDAVRPQKKRAFAITLFHFEITVRTVRKTANS